MWSIIKSTLSRYISDVIHMESNTIYYGVHVPSDIQVQDSDGSKNVFFDKSEALKEVKKYKKARFKAFQFYHEALEFALHGSEFPNNNSTLELKLKSNEVVVVAASASAQSVGEKPSQFRGPKSQDLVKLRKAIETGDSHYVKTTIWENPRYLISSGDTPAILQEGSRYNALHVAAKAKNAEMCDLILSTVGLPEFIQLLYGEENRSNSEEGSKILLDLYLNTPDKGLNETPLHFAVKFGAAEVVEVLVSYPQCDKTVLNKYSDTPKDMICSRVPNPSRALIEKIKNLLDDRYYVPVLRSEDNCIQPVIGEPFSPTSPPKYNQNPIDPRLEIHAYAGPMKKDEANIFRKKWKTPPRTPVACSTPSKPATECESPMTHFMHRASLELDFRLQDTEKGLERVGRVLAKKFNVGWKEYWPFLDTFTDLTTEGGLANLELYFKNRYLNSFSESMTNSINKRKNESLTNSVNSELNSMEESPISELCRHFDACSLADSQPMDTCNFKTSTSTAQHHFKQREVILDNVPRSNLSPTNILIERSCQVFAHRLSYQILNQMDTVTAQTLESLESAIKHLKSLVASFMEDSSFASFNFQCVHSRIAYLISCNLKQTLTFDEELDEKISNLVLIIQKYDKMVDLFSSDDEEHNNYRQPSCFVRRKSTSNSKQVLCLIEGILKSLDCISENEFININTEEDCNRAWNNALPCACVWKTNKTSRRGSLVKKCAGKYFTKTASIMRTQNKMLESVSKRLSFLEDDYGDRNDNFENSEILYKQPSRDTTDGELRYSAEDLSSSSEEEEEEEEEEEYVTANTSPVSSSGGDSCEENFEDVEMNDLDVFIDGDSPTKMDYAVYTAIKDLNIDAETYPYIYRWKHSIKLFSEDTRINWPSPCGARYQLDTSVASSPRADMNWSSVTPPHSWLRVTGQNSPIRSLKAYSRHTVSLPYGENCYYS